MTYLLDTNTCIQYLNDRSENVKARLNSATKAEIFLCAVVKAELYFGAENSQSPEKTMKGQREFAEQFVSLPFDDKAAEQHGRIRAYLKRIGKPIGHYDLLIAAIALANNLTLVTHNTDEFRRVPNLRIEDWEAEPTP
jgi:tRNA(fMet)-specific endonuclease VapC